MFLQINFLIYTLSLQILSALFVKPLGKIIDIIQYTSLILFLMSVYIYIVCLKTTNNILINIILLFIIVFIFKYLKIVEKKIKYYEFAFIIVLLIISISILLYDLNLINIYFALEMQTMIFYSLIAAKTISKNAIEASIKYFIMNFFATIFFIYGLYLIYSISGSTELNFIISVINIEYNSFIIASTLITIAFFIKIGTFPFHYWIVDIYHGLPIYLLLLLFNIPKIILYLLIFLVNMLVGLSFYYFIINIVTMGVGFFRAIGQVGFQRFLSFSNMAGNGYFLGLASNGDFFSFFILDFTLIIYTIISNVILYVLYAFRSIKTFLYKIYHLYIIKKTNFIFALCLVISFLNSASIPPLAGFYQKIVLFYVFIRNFNVPLIFLLLMLSVLAAFAYLRLIPYLFFFSHTKMNFFKFQFRFITYIIIILTLTTIFNGNIINCFYLSIFSFFYKIYLVCLLYFYKIKYSDRFKSFFIFRNLFIIFILCIILWYIKSI